MKFKNLTTIGFIAFSVVAVSSAHAATVVCLANTATTTGIQVAFGQNLTGAALLGGLGMLALLRRRHA